MSVIDLRELLKNKVNRIRVDVTIPPEDCNANDENVLFLKTPEIEGWIRRNEENLFLEGRVTTLLSIPCSKCLEEISFPVDKSFLVVLVTEAEEYFMDFDSYCYKKDQIHLWEIVWTQILDELPYRLLCREDCQGICKQCGNNFNYGNCDCTEEEKPIDERMAKLKELLD